MKITWDQLSDATLLTANRRQATHMVKRYDRYHQAHQRLSWSSLKALPLDTWLAALWEITTTDERILLTDSQSLLLWQQIIDEDQQQHPLLDSARTAELAKNAWGLLQNWRLTLAELREFPSEDTQAFCQWAQAFTAWCQTHNVIDKDELINRLLNTDSATFILPNRLILSGFIEFTPAVSMLLDNLAQATQIQIARGFTAEEGLLVEDWQQQDESPIRATFPNNRPEIIQVTCEDPNDELLQLSQWVKTEIEHNPKARLACIIGNLNNQWDAVENIFNQTLTPDAWMALETVNQRAYNISAGKPLTQFAIIQTALTVLELSSHSLVPFVRLSTLLLNPYLGAAQAEMAARALLESRLREQGESELPWRSLALSRHARDLQTPERFYCPQLVAHIEATLAVIKSIPKQPQLPAVWCAHWNQLLQTIGWPGDRSLNSQEYQLKERWQALLAEFSQTAIITGAIGHTQAIATLKHLASNSIFQPQSDHTQVQILGLLEAAGLPFDKIWITQFDQRNWPPPANPNPFIPNSLSKQLNMAHASAEREVQFCQTLLQGFLANSNQLIVSHAKTQEGQANSASSLLARFTQRERQPVTLSNHVNNDLWNQPKLTLSSLLDTTGPQLALNQQIKGGTGIFKVQATCPFKAFAELRLGAQPLALTATGLTAAERGQLIHATLAHIWQTLQDQQTLLALSDTALSTLITKAVKAACVPLVKKRPLTLKPHYLHLEQQRMLQLCQAWLAIEKNRQPFKVLAEEYQQQAQVGELKLSMQVDRVDVQVDGSTLIIDYKTGRPNINDWFGERPTEPQLPLYCITSDKTISGIAFAQLRPEALTFKGVQATLDNEPKGVVNVAKLKQTKEHSSWVVQCQDWQTQMTRLANEYQHGVAAVTPKNAQACQYCQCKPFCRVQRTADR